jgi:hypothetical protein
MICMTNAIELVNALELALDALRTATSATGIEVAR